MNIFKRSILYIVRKKYRTLLLFTILLVVSTLTLSGLSILDATEESSAELRESTGSGFTIERNLSTATKSNGGNNFIYQQEFITNEIIEKISEIDGIKGYNAKKNGNGTASLQGIDGNNLETIVYTDWYDDTILEYSTNVFASFNTSYDSYFTSNKFELTEGRHITEDDENAVIISDELARKYNIGVGDKVKFALTEEFVEVEKQNSDISVNSIEVEVIGIFNILSEQSDKQTLAQYELYENYIFSDASFFTKLYSTWPLGMEELGEGYESADFFITDPKQLSNIMAEVADISSINWNNFNLIANDEVYQESSSSMSNVEKLITTMITIVVIIAAVIITLILSMWIRSRIREAGILMAAGISKFNIVMQYILETIVIAALVFALSYYTSNTVAGTLGHIIDSTIAAKDVIVIMDNFALICSVGILVILAALIISSIPIIRLKPKEILSKIS